MLDGLAVLADQAMALFLRLRAANVAWRKKPTGPRLPERASRRSVVEAPRVWGRPADAMGRTAVFRHFTEAQIYPVINGSMVGLVVLAAVGVGLVLGTYPARRAAKLRRG